MSDPIEVPEWYKPGGGMMYRRSCLPSNHPESEYNYIKNVLKKTPEDYGVYTDRHNFIKKELNHLSKEELMVKLADAMETIHNMERAGF